MHDEIVVQCDERHAEKAEAWLRKAMVDGMDEVLNGPETGEARVPVEVETRIAKTWAGCLTTRHEGGCKGAPNAFVGEEPTLGSPGG